MAKIIKVFGSPGTGKTTTLSKMIQEDFEKYGAENVLLASFSRTAVAELLKRNITKEMVRDLRRKKVYWHNTLHGICYNLLKKPEIMDEESKYFDFSKAFPQFRLQSVIDSEKEKSYGDKLFSEMQLNRAKMIPVEEWKPEVLKLKTAWDSFKGDCLDFTDLIEKVIETGQFPNWINMKAMYVDEAQDLTPLEITLVEKWSVSNKLEKVVYGLDDDQTIMSFKGAVAERILQTPYDELIVLPKSFRVPSQIHKKAIEIVEKIGNRQEKQYDPMEREGKILEVNYNLNSYDLIDFIKANPEKDIMVLASCTYMFNGLKKHLKEAGITYHNPYTERAEFNPIKFTFDGKRIGFNQRLYAFIKGSKKIVTFDIEDEKLPDIEDEFGDFEDDGIYDEALPDLDDFFNAHPELEGISIEADVTPSISNDNEAREAFTKSIDPDNFYWTGLQIKMWSDLLSGVFIRGQKEMIENLEDEKSYGFEDIFKFIHPKFIDDVYRPNGQFIFEHLNSKWKKSGNKDFCEAILRNGDFEVLMKKPRVILGTVQSVKGGEVDIVVVSPDLSRSGRKDFESNPDNTHRLFYVAVTRAKEELILLQPSSAFHYKF